MSSANNKSKWNPNKVLVATYHSCSIFKIPKEFDNLDDDPNVQDYYIKWNTLYIKPVGKEWIQIEGTDPSACHEAFKNPKSTEIADRADWFCEEDEEDPCECSKCGKKEVDDGDGFLGQDFFCTECRKFKCEICKKIGNFTNEDVYRGACSADCGLQDLCTDCGDNEGWDENGEHYEDGCCLNCAKRNPKQAELSCDDPYCTSNAISVCDPCGLFMCEKHLILCDCGCAKEIAEKNSESEAE